MCGIAGIHRRTDASFPGMGRLANELLLSIENRGVDSTGYLAMLDNGKVQTQKAVVRARKFIKYRQSFESDARTLLLHTRFATIGQLTELNAHPQISGRCAAVHNGTIYNASDLFTTFGLKRRAQVDSEIIPALIDYAGWKQAGDAIELMQGGAAVAVVNADHPKDLLLGRTRSYPLIYMVTDDYIIWASTAAAIRMAWQMAFREATPRKASWGELSEWQMLRSTAGRIEVTDLTNPRPDPWSWTRPARKAQAAAMNGKRSKPKAATKNTKSTAKRRRKKARKGQLAMPVSRAERPAAALRAVEATRRLPVPPEPFEREPWMEDIVTDLMRTEGVSRQDAEELVYGHSLGDDHDDYMTRLWDELSEVIAKERGES